MLRQTLFGLQENRSRARGQALHSSQPQKAGAGERARFHSITCGTMKTILPISVML